MPLIEFNMYNSIGDIENNNQKYSIEYRLVINDEKTIEYKSEYDKNYVDGLHNHNFLMNFCIYRHFYINK